MIENKTIEEIQNMLDNGETFVMNLTAQWCSDCTDQAQNLPLFNELLASSDVACHSIVVQQEKRIYLSSEHQLFTEQLGGHGFPRTVLVKGGKVLDANNVEVITKEQLTQLAEQFKKQLA